MNGNGDEVQHNGRMMMDANELIEEISAKDFALDKFVQVAIDHERARDEIVHQLITHPDIMVYYHCYYVVSKASQKRPDLFYQYWHEIAALLQHENSYHRNFALTIIAHLTPVDHNDFYSEMFHDYFEHINDIKFSTGQCCVQNATEILKNKPELKEKIIKILLDVDNRCDYSEKQRELLKCDVLGVLDEVFEEAPDKVGLEEFFRTGLKSISPKTRQKAKELVAKYDL